MVIGYRDCPFCGSDENLFIQSLMNDCVEIKCTACQLSMRAYPEKERYAPVENNLYKQIPAKDAIDVLREKWNRRAGDEDK